MLLQGKSTVQKAANLCKSYSLASSSSNANIDNLNNVLSWRPLAIDDWVRREARPISLRQLTYFGRSLTKERLLSSANYVRTELPTRLAHRLRDMHTLPYSVVTNRHIAQVYSLYYSAFETFRQIPEIKSVDENNAYCATIQKMLNEHLSVIPKLAIGMLEVRDSVPRERLDSFMTTLLKSRISRRVIAEQHLALTETFRSQKKGAVIDKNANTEFVGTVFLHCKAKEVVENCTKVIQNLCRQCYGSSIKVPDVKIQGHQTANFPYIVSHLEYILGELIRNAMQAVIERNRSNSDPLPVEILLCEAPQHVIIRISDQGGGIPQKVIPHLWSFSKGHHREVAIENLSQVPRMAATMDEIISSPVNGESNSNYESADHGKPYENAKSFLSLSSRPPDLKLGIGLPMSRIYAEYWAGSLELHSLEGYGVDAFLQIPKLGNKNEQLATRASMDSV